MRAGTEGISFMNETQQQNVPTLGAALVIAELERLHNWVMEANRDV